MEDVREVVGFDDAVPFDEGVVLWPPTRRVSDVELLGSVEVVSIALAATIAAEIEAAVLSYVLVTGLLSVLIVLYS